MDWMKNKVIIVTGGASGIGKAIVKESLTKGAIVVIADLNEDKGNAVVKNFSKEFTEIHFVKTDVTDVTSIENLVDKAKSLGPIHYLVNSAGVQTYGTVVSTSQKTWDFTMDVNLKSIYTLSKYVIPEMKKNPSNSGAIVNISSVQGIRSQKNVAAYATSKAAVIALTRTMGLDYASERIQVNCICPGSIDTPMLRFGAEAYGDPDEVIKEWGENHPIGRIGKPSEIAKVAMFLLSPDASFIVGQAIIADGGLGSEIL